jgi:SP family facilitated glucose transporter-like MFS transporter 3
MTQFACVLGILFADVVGFALANATSWRWMFSLTTVMAVLQLLLTPFLVESPRWLLEKNPNSSKARFIIKRLRGFRYDQEVETEVEHYVSLAGPPSSRGGAALRSITDAAAAA